jgi:bifunctional NMN adenylyltransferase/nudix hydrolase
MEIILDSKKFDMGVIVGRFQVPYLHDGHKKLISTVRDTHSRYMVFIGVAEGLATKKNPLDFVTRMKMVQEEFPDAIILPIKDVASDELWSKDLDQTIREAFPIGTVRLYSGRDGFLSSYKGQFATFEFADLTQMDGTKLRELTSKKIISTKEGREGLIYGVFNQYSRVFPTVDIAVVKTEGRTKEVLLGKKKHYSGLVFLGGFVDPSDSSLEETVLREVQEEANMEVGHEDIHYIGSFRVDEDWRYKNQEEKIITSLFKVNYIFGSTTKNEEFEELEFYPINSDTLEMIDNVHKELFRALMVHEKVRNTKKESIENE